MTPLSAFRSRIAPRVQGCFDPIIDQAVLDTCIDFCERSLVVRRMLATFPTVAGTGTYTPPVTAVTQSVTKFIRVWRDDVEIAPADEGYIPGSGGFFAGPAASQAAPSFFGSTEPGSIALYPTPDKVYTINSRVALRPTRAATTVEDQLYEEWVEVIVAGALMRLMSMPDDWQNLPLAKAYAAQYEAGINVAMLKASQGQTRAELRVSPVRI